MRPLEELKIVFIGTGAIGGTIGGWIAQQHSQTYLLGRGPGVEILRARGLSLYPGDRPEQVEHIPVRAIDSLAEVPDADVVVMAVKLYDLEPAARMVADQLGDRPLVVGLQNGVENQRILPRDFTRLLYGVVAFNAWVDEPGRIGYQSRGPLVLGTLDEGLQAELQDLAALFNRGLETHVTPRLQDAVHGKLVINLSNSVTTLLGLNRREIGRLDLFQDILANTLYEGVRVIRAAGYREERQGRLPSWRTLWAAAKLPQILTRATFRRNLKKMTLSSMGQDVFLRGRRETELEYLNGYLLELAGQHGVPVPYNRAVYRLCKQRFSRPDFEPMEVREVWEEVQRERKGG